MKWLGRDVWTELFGKQIDNLKTDRQGIYKLYDDTFRPNTRVHAEDRARVHAYLARSMTFYSSLLGGILAALGIQAEVSAEYQTVPSKCAFIVRVMM